MNGKNTEMLSVAIVEDDILRYKFLKEYIECEDVKITAIYSSGESALDAIPSLPLPDILLVDIGLPGISGIEVIRKLKEKFPVIEMIVHTVFEDTKTIIDAIKAGASGYILKASPQEDYRKAMWEIKKGGSFLSGSIARKILLEFQLPRHAAKENTPEKYDLTNREKEILKELVRGVSYKKIAKKLNISVHTVNNHTRSIYQKLRVNSRGEAVAAVIKQNIKADT